MISLQEALAIHNILLEQFGGGNGLRDQGALEAALNRPFNTFDQVELYPEAIDKAAAIIESILINHPFVDGNKRTGYVLMRLLLMQNGLDIQASQEEKHAFVIAIAKGEFRIEEIRVWLRKKVVIKSNN